MDCKMMEGWAKVVGVWMDDNKKKDKKNEELMKFFNCVVKENNIIQCRLQEEKLKVAKIKEENEKLKEKCKDQSWKMKKLNKIVIGMHAEIKELKSKLRRRDESKCEDHEISSIMFRKGSCPNIVRAADKPVHSPKENELVEECETAELLKINQLEGKNSKIEDLENKLEESLNDIKELKERMNTEAGRHEIEINKLKDEIVEKMMIIDQTQKESSLNSKYFERKLKEKDIEYQKLLDELTGEKTINQKLLKSLENEGKWEKENKERNQELKDYGLLPSRSVKGKKKEALSFCGSKSDSESYSEWTNPFLQCEEPSDRKNKVLDAPCVVSENSFPLLNSRKVPYKIVISKSIDSPKVRIIKKIRNLTIQVSPNLSPNPSLSENNVESL